MCDISILVVDDNIALTELLKVLIEGKKCGKVDAVHSYDEAVAFVNKNVPAIVVTDHNLGEGRTGVDVVKYMTKLYPPPQCILITGVSEIEIVVGALRAGACDFLTKPISNDILFHTIEKCVERHELLIENDRYRNNLEEIVGEQTAKLRILLTRTVESLVRALEARDMFTHGHQIRVSVLAVKICEKMYVPEGMTETIRLAALLHDIGKLTVPGDLLSKPGLLSCDEKRVIEVHCVAGYEIIKDIPFDAPIAQTILQHHEKLDGSGYPYGIKGKDVIPEARILTVADVVEAMLSHRPYRPSIGIDTVIDELTKNSGVKYDNEVVDACLRVLKECNNDIDKVVAE